MKWALDKVYTKLMNDLNANPDVKNKYALVESSELIALLEEMQTVCETHNLSSISGMTQCAEDLKNAGHLSSNQTLNQIKNNVERFDLDF